MSTTTVRHIEWPVGKGIMTLNGSYLATVYYSLNVMREFVDGVPGDWIIAAELSAYALDRSGTAALKSVPAGAHMTLILRDGRIWESIPPDPEPEQYFFHLRTCGPRGLVDPEPRFSRMDGWKVRPLKTGDDEDPAYHPVSLSPRARGRG